MSWWRKPEPTDANVDQVRDENDAHGLAIGADRQGGTMDDIEARYRADGIERDYNGGRSTTSWEDR